MIWLTLLFIAGFAAAAVLGTQTYFLGEQSKPIHERNWKSEGFHDLAATFTGQQVPYEERASSPRAEVALQKLAASAQ